MRKIILFTVLMLAATSLVYLGMSHHSTMEQARVQPGGGVAVLELFTSEGCSSCPAADQLLSEIYRTYDGKGLPVYPLAFHVDYWNYLGWHDEYSHPAFTQRQYAYGEKFRLNSVYTPQLVVNGTTEFVGSSRSRMVEAIARVLSEGTEVSVHLTAERSDRTLELSIKLDHVPDESVVVMAVAERDIKRQIRSGENSGMTLTHDNVVRVFERMPAAARLTKKISLPADLKPANSSVVVFVQHKFTLKVLGATAQDLVDP